MSLLTSTEFWKTTYLPGLNNQLENAPGTLLGLLPKQGVDIEGGQTKMKLRVGDSLGQATIDEGADFPDPGDPTYDEATVTVTRLSHTIMLTMDEWALLDSGNAAAVPVVSEKMSAAQEAMQRDIIRQSWGDGQGVVATVASFSGSTLTLDADATDQYDRDRNIWFEAGRMRYDIVDPTTGASQISGPFTVSDYDGNVTATASIALTGAAAGDYVVRSGTWATGGAYASREFTGIAGLVADDNTYLGIDRTASGKDYWKATVVDNSGTLRSVSRNLIHELLNKMAKVAPDGKQPTSSGHCAFANYGTWSSYHELMTPDIRYSVDKTPDIGWGQGIEMFGLQLYRDIHTPKSRIYVIDKDKVKFTHAKHDQGGILDFLTRGGDMWFQGTASSGQGHSARVYAYLTGMLGMHSTRPRAHGVLDDLTETSGF